MTDRDSQITDNLDETALEKAAIAMAFPLEEDWNEAMTEPTRDWYRRAAQRAVAGYLDGLDGTTE